MSIKVSIFDSHRNTTPINSGDLNTVLANIKDGRWQDHILAYRTGKTTKDKLPAFTTSGEFKARKSDQLIQHSVQQGEKAIALSSRLIQTDTSMHTSALKSVSPTDMS